MPASAVGVRLVGAVTVIVTVSAALSSIPSFTIRENTKIASGSPKFNEGAVKVGPLAVVLESVTVGPEVCVHVYVSGLLSASVEPDPSSVAMLALTIV